MVRFSIWLRLLTAILLLASVGIAAPKTAAPPSASPRSSSKAARQRKPHPPLSENAKKHFEAGLGYADDPSGPKWEEAYREFLAAYEDTPSWVLMNNIGLCALNLERDAEAIAAYKAYLDGGGEESLSAKARKQIETDIATLSASLVRIEITAEPAELTIVDERKNNKSVLITNTYPLKDGKVELGLHPGRHRIVAEAPGYTSEEWFVDAAPASTHSHAFKLAAVKSAETIPLSMDNNPVPVTPAPEAAPSRITTPFIISAVAAGVFTVGATVTGVMSLSKKSDYKDAPDAAEADRIAKTGKTLSLITDIEIGAAAVAATLATVFYFTAPTQTKSETKTASGGQVRLVPTASPSSAGLHLSGRF